MRPAWIRDDGRNALANQNLDRVRACFQKPGAVAFGWHYFYGAGAGRSDLIFGSAEDLINLIEQARPGDHFTLFDLDRVALLAIKHLGEPTSQGLISLAAADRLELARAGTESQWKAVILLQRACGTDGHLARCSIVEREPEDLVDNWEEAKGYDARVTWPRDGMFLPLTRWFGEFLAFDEADLDRNIETGLAVATVTSTELNRTYALIDAKRPDDQGLVPISGAY
jgi:hypothetical protein